MNAPRVLLAGDEPVELSQIKGILEREGYTVEMAGNGEQVLQWLNQQVVPELILLDMFLAGASGLQVLGECKKIRPQQKVVMISCTSEANQVVQAIKQGAEDFITKPFAPSRLQDAVCRAIGPGCSTPVPITTSPARAPEVVDSLDDDQFFLAASPVMKQIRAQVALVAKVDMPVLLLGESGVGKEIIAHLIHKMSPRAKAPLMKVNCAALPDDLLESELFGFEAGAFTGASKSKPGKFELCNKGSMLLD